MNTKTTKKTTSLKKAISWRMISIIISLIISFTFYKDVETVLWFTIVFHASLTILYYFHERLWVRINNKKVKHA